MPRLVLISLLISLMATPAQARQAVARRGPANDVPIQVAPSEKAQLDLDLKAVQTIQFHLDNVASGTRRYRYLRAGVFGVLPFFLTGVYIAEDRLLTGEPRNIAKGVVGITAAVFAVGAVASALSPAGAESGAGAYRAVPVRNAQDASLKRAFGEAQLRKFADTERLTRRMIGGAFLTVGVANLVWYFGTGSNTDLNFLTYLAGAYGGLGVLLLTLHSPAETEYDAFISQKASEPKTTVSWSLVPTPNGLQAGIRLQF